VERIEDQAYALVVAGSGFASSFFLHEWLRHAPSDARVLVIERGQFFPHTWQVEHDRNSDLPIDRTYRRDGLASKGWVFTVAFGGGSNCWTGCTPRMLPSDFEMQSRYGVGLDWPLTYDDLEPFYCEAEAIMAVSGPEDYSLSHRGSRFPQPPHRLCEPEAVLSSAYPGLYYPQATARARAPVGVRPACCGSAVCKICPMNAKFTIENSMLHVYRDARVSVLLGHEVVRLELEGGRLNGVICQGARGEHKALCDLAALGANAIFNPAILLRSGLSHPRLGTRLHEQISTAVEFDLKGMTNFQGSTLVTGQGYMFYDGPQRREYGGCLTEFINDPRSLLRHEFGRWTERAKLNFIVEDLPLEENRVALDPDGMPVAEFVRYSDYGLRGLQKVREYVDQLAALLPVEAIRFESESGARLVPRFSEKHIQGTVIMGRSPEDSVVDRNLVHHSLRNLVVLGSSSFPTGAPANPTLTLCALSLMSARSLWE
jgi:choline dehydrogenase-like flavoprotein